MDQDPSTNSHEPRSFEQTKHTFEPRVRASSTDHTSLPPLDPDLLALLEDADPQVREAAAQLLGEDGDPAAVDPLLELLHDPAEAVRAAATEALGWMRSRQALPALSGALHDPSDLVRAAAARALGRIRDPSALSTLQPLAADPSTDVRRAVAEALDTLDPARAPAAHAQHRARSGGSGDEMAPRRLFADHMFRDFSDYLWNFPWLRNRPGRTFANLEFQRCRFEHCILSVTNNPRRRSTIRNVRLIDCEILASSLDAALVEDVVVDGLETSGLCIIWGAAFRHVTLRGRLNAASRRAKGSWGWITTNCVSGAGGTTI